MYVRTFKNKTYLILHGQLDCGYADDKNDDGFVVVDDENVNNYDENDK